jgi:transposase InsO family protein
MNIHENAKLTPFGRERMVRAMLSGQAPEAAARDAGVCARTARKWLKRYQQEGPAGLADRSSRPTRVRCPTPPEKVAEVERLRRRRLPGKEIALRLGVSPATVSRILRKARLSRAGDLDPAPPPNRYEYARPGAMIHMDVKKLGRFSGIGHRITGDRATAIRTVGRGWEFVHVAIDDNSRIAFSKIMPDEKQGSAIAFLKAARAYYRSLGIKIERVMTDDGSCYKARAFAKACRRHSIKQIRTRPHTPRTNGKAERFIKTALAEWVYAQPFETSELRAAELSNWLHRYNCHRPHSAIGDKPPISRLPQSGNNLLRVHT